jgi:hypothetical protein
MNSIFTEDAFYMCCFFVGRSEKEGSIEEKPAARGSRPFYSFQILLAALYCRFMMYLSTILYSLASP